MNAWLSLIFILLGTAVCVGSKTWLVSNLKTAFGGAAWSCGRALKLANMFFLFASELAYVAGIILIYIGVSLDLIR